jgi:hypothetical protein
MKLLQISCLLAVLLAAHALPVEETTTAETTTKMVHEIVHPIDHIKERSDMEKKETEEEKKRFEDEMTRRDEIAKKDNVEKKDNIDREVKEEDKKAIVEKKDNVEREVKVEDKKSIVEKKDNVEREIKEEDKKEADPVVKRITEIITKRTIEEPVHISEIKKSIYMRENGIDRRENVEDEVQSADKKETSDEDKKRFGNEKRFGEEKRFESEEAKRAFPHEKIVTVEKIYKRTIIEPAGMEKKDSDIIKKWAEMDKRNHQKKDSMDKKFVEEPVVKTVEPIVKTTVDETKPVTRRENVDQTNFRW